MAMNQFNLPGCLIIEEGACERLNEILADCIPGIEKKENCHCHGGIFDSHYEILSG